MSRTPWAAHCSAALPPPPYQSLHHCDYGMSARPAGHMSSLPSDRQQCIEVAFVSKLGLSVVHSCPGVEAGQRCCCSVCSASPLVSRPPQA